MHVCMSTSVPTLWEITLRSGWDELSSGKNFPWKKVDEILDEIEIKPIAAFCVCIQDKTEEGGTRFEMLENPIVFILVTFPCGLVKIGSFLLSAASCTHYKIVCWKRISTILKYNPRYDFQSYPKAKKQYFCDPTLWYREFCHCFGLLQKK